MTLDRIRDVEEFRRHTRQWIIDTLPPTWRAGFDRMDQGERVEFQRWWLIERAKVGLATPHWPSDAGGADLSLEYQIIMAEEFARAATPELTAYVVSLNHIPATLIQWGTEQQRRTFLPGVAQGDIWCQGFSEPGAGSDLASLRCRAVRDGDAFVVNGQKIWSSIAAFARYCILLVRTDPDAPKHKGISFLIMDMSTSGIDVRPIRQANGESDFNEMFLSDVRIPVANLVGPENAGWEVARTTLSSERGLIAFEYAERQRYRYENYFRCSVANQVQWLDDVALRSEFTCLFAEMQGVRRLVRRLLRLSESGEETVGILPAVVKLAATDLRRRFGDFLVRAEGIDAQLEGGAVSGEHAMFEYVTAFAMTISGGSNEIMRNIIAERGLGLPR